MKVGRFKGDLLMNNDDFRQPSRGLQPSAFGLENGFSLFELMAVLIILAIGAAVVAPASGKMLAKISFRRDGLEVKKQLRTMKALAMSKGQAVRVTLEDRSFLVQLGKGEEQRQELKIAEECGLTMNPTVLHFSPLGTATPAKLVLATGERQRTIELDALTGLPY